MVKPCAVSLTVGELEKLFETDAPPKVLLAALDMVSVREEPPVRIPAPKKRSWRSRVSTVVKVVALAGAVAALAYRVSC